MESEVMALPEKWRSDRCDDPHTAPWTLGYLRAKREDANELEAALSRPAGAEWVDDATCLAVIRAVLNDPFYGTEFQATPERMERTRAAIAAIPTPHGGEKHPDDIAVDQFAEAMKLKLAEARAKGRGGWQDKEDCPQQRLSDMLRAHVAKGDPRDVANFCMFLHQRGEGILPSSEEGA